MTGRSARGLQCGCYPSKLCVVKQLSENLLVEKFSSKNAKLGTENPTLTEFRGKIKILRRFLLPTCRRDRGVMLLKYRGGKCHGLTTKRPRSQASVPSKARETRSTEALYPRKIFNKSTLKLHIFVHYFCRSAEGRQKFAIQNYLICIFYPSRALWGTYPTLKRVTCAESFYTKIIFSSLENTGRGRTLRHCREQNNMSWM